MAMEESKAQRQALVRKKKTARPWKNFGEEKKYVFSVVFSLNCFETKIVMKKAHKQKNMVCSSVFPVLLLVRSPALQLASQLTLYIPQG